MFIFSFTVKTRTSFWWHVKDKCSLQTAFCHQWKGQHISSTYLFVNETLNFVFKFSNSLSTFQWNNQWISLAANFNIVIPYLITKSYKYLMSFWSCVLVKLETSLLMHSWLQSHWWKTWLINDAVKISHMKTFIIFKFHQSNILPIKQFLKKKINKDSLTAESLSSIYSSFRGTKLWSIISFLFEMQSSKYILRHGRNADRLTQF